MSGRWAGVITFRVMMEVLVVVKILRSLSLHLDDRKKGTLPLDDNEGGLTPDDKKIALSI